MSTLFWPVCCCNIWIFLVCASYLILNQRHCTEAHYSACQQVILLLRCFLTTTPRTDLYKNLLNSYLCSWINGASLHLIFLWSQNTAWSHNLRKELLSAGVCVCVCVCVCVVCVCVCACVCVSVLLSVPLNIQTDNNMGYSPSNPLTLTLKNVTNRWCWIMTPDHSVTLILMSCLCAPRDVLCCVAGSNMCLINSRGNHTNTK